MRKPKTNNRRKRKLHFVFLQMPINKKDESTFAISVLKLESISVVSKSSSISPSSCNNITTICLAEQSSECTEQVCGVTLEIGTHFNHAFRKSPLRDYRFTKIRYLNKAVRLALIARTRQKTNTGNFKAGRQARVTPCTGWPTGTWRFVNGTQY